MYRTTLNLRLTSITCYVTYQGLEAGDWPPEGIEP